jgi:NAD(P)H dehydrogenase (quinone)
MTIAVTGASGQLGRLVIAGLTAAQPGRAPLALARDPARAADLRVPVRAFNYNAPDAAALEGVGTLLLISSSEIGQRARQHRAVIDAARAAGVRHLVYTSLLHADTSLIDLAAEHRATEAALAASGLPMTLLRNGWYTENHAATVQGAKATGVMIGSAGDGRIASATRADYAAAAVAVLTGAGHEGRTYELAGDDSWTMQDLADAVARGTGRDVTYTDMAEADHAAALAGHGMPTPVAAMIAGWDAATAKGALLDEGRQLSTLIGRPTTPMADTVRALLA